MVPNGSYRAVMESHAEQQWLQSCFYQLYYQFPYPPKFSRTILHFQNKFTVPRDFRRSLVLGVLRFSEKNRPLGIESCLFGTKTTRSAPYLLLVSLVKPTCFGSLKERL